MRKTVQAQIVWPLLIVGFLLSAAGDCGGGVVTFENLPVNSDGWYNGNPRAGAPLRDNYTVRGIGSSFGADEYLQTWSSGGVEFNNHYTPDYDSWTGWSWSRVMDSATAGFTSQYASWAGGGAGTSGGDETAGGTYAVAHGDGAWFNLAPGAVLQSVDLSNTTYAALSMQQGDAFAKRFGGSSGTDPDYFRVTLSGYESLDLLGQLISSVTVSLADYTFADSLLDVVLAGWQTIDLTALGNARSVGLTFESSDVGPWGINTPAYVALDNLVFRDSVAVPEPMSPAFAAAAVGGFLFFHSRSCRRKKLAKSAPGLRGTLPPVA